MAEEKVNFQSRKELQALILQNLKR